MLKRTQTRRGSRAGGFTLVELLVVMTIIIFLMTILIITVGNVFETAKIAGTQATINKTKALLNDRMESLNMAFDSNRFSGEIKLREQQLINQGVTPGIAAALAPMFIRKEKEALFFPQSFAETKGRLSAGSTHLSATESSEVLYWMLTQMEVLGSLPTGEADFTDSELADTDGDGLKEIVDAWGQPVRFYRWPTRLIRPAAGSGIASTAPVTDIDGYRVDVAGILMPDFGKDFLIQDPDDPLGQISAAFNGDETLSEDFEKSYHTINTMHPFLIVSMGADEELGLYEPTDKANYGHLACPKSEILDGTQTPGDSPLNDNITNRQTTGGRN